MSISGQTPPIETTFAVLSANTSAEVDVLLALGIRSSVDDVARRSARLIASKPSQPRIAEAVKRQEPVNIAAAEEFASHGHQLEPLLKQALMDGDATTRRGSLEFIRQTANFLMLPQLMPICDDGSHALNQPAIACVREIVERIANRLSGIEERALSHLKDDDIQRKKFDILADFDRRSEKFDDLDAPQLLVECILLLGDLNCAAVKNLLENRGNACRHMVKTVLSQGLHPRLVHVVCHNLTRKEPHQKVMQVFLTRDDIGFIKEVLSWLPATPTGALHTNLRQIDELPWLSLTHAAWTEIPPDMHPKVVGLINSSGLSAESKRELKKWILQHSGPEGRAAAGDLLEAIPKEEKQELICEALEDDDPEVEAWATHHLRKSELPDALAQLLKRLDAVSDVVRDAARDELADFNLEKVYPLLPGMPRTKALRCAEIMMKVDPETPNHIRDDLLHPFKAKKLRAARAAKILGFVDLVLPALGKLSEDPEAGIRRTALEAIAESASREALPFVERRLQDPNLKVRQAAKVALDQIHQQIMV